MLPDNHAAWNLNAIHLNETNFIRLRTSTWFFPSSTEKNLPNIIKLQCVSFVIVLHNSSQPWTWPGSELTSNTCIRDIPNGLSFEMHTLSWQKKTFIKANDKFTFLSSNGRCNYTQFSEHWHLKTNKFVPLTDIYEHCRGSTGTFNFRKNLRLRRNCKGIRAIRIESLLKNMDATIDVAEFKKNKWRLGE